MWSGACTATRSPSRTRTGLSRRCSAISPISSRSAASGVCPVSPSAGLHNRRMRIDQILAAQAPVFSFEFFPPKTEAGGRNLYGALAELQLLEPSFVSVTYGAGGSTREKTIEIVKRIKDEHSLEAMAHFTCVGATVPELRGTLDEMRGAGIDNVLALRGDPPAGEEQWTANEGG